MNREIENCAWCGKSYYRIKGQCMCSSCLKESYGKDMTKKLKAEIKSSLKHNWT